MPVQKVTRDEILQKAMVVFKRQGFHRTTMDDLARACGLLKGSFYYYFRSKEELMRAILESVNAYNQTHVFAIAYEDALPAGERLSRLLDKLLHELLRTEGGCLMGNLVLETALVSDEFRAPLQTHFTNALAALAHIYRTVYPDEQARDLARQVAADLQGSLLLWKLDGDDHQLFRCRDRALNLLQAATGQSGLPTT